MLLQFDSTKYSSALGESFTPIGIFIFVALFGFFFWYNVLRKQKNDKR
jgi:hypothetical protein